MPGSVRAISGCLAIKQQTGVAPLFRYIIANGPSMAHLRNAACIFGPPGICKSEGLVIALKRQKERNGES